MYFVYVIQHTKSLQFYFGFTTNLKQRLESHNSGKNKSTSRKDGEWILVYCEVYKSKKDALIRESKIKQHGNAKKGIKSRITNSVLTDYKK